MGLADKTFKCYTVDQNSCLEMFLVFMKRKRLKKKKQQGAVLEQLGAWHLKYPGLEVTHCVVLF